MFNDKYLENKLEDVFENDDLKSELLDVLEKSELTLKLHLDGKDTICIEQVKNANIEKDKNKEDESVKTIDEKTDNLPQNTRKEENKKENFAAKFFKSTYKVFEEFFDSMARKFLKEKYKLNYSVYNDGKKAVVAAKNRDFKTFLKKGTDAILYVFKKIPAASKKVIKNTKNVAIDEIFSWVDE